MKGLRFSVVSVATIALALCAATAYGNVYPSGVSVDTATLSDTCGTAKVTYVLNENADGDGTNPGVKIEVVRVSDDFVVRTVTFARVLRGTHTFEWDGRDDSGNRAGNVDYKFRITAADNGYSGWTRISNEAQIGGSQPWNYTWFERCLGVSVNTDAASANYGKIYVSQASNLTSAGGAGRPMEDGIYVLNADCSPVANPSTTTGVWTGGVNWAADGTAYSSPMRSVMGPDNRLYVVDYYGDNVYEFSEDMSTATLVVGRSNNNFSSAQWVRGVWVTGTQATGDRVIYLVNSNYNDTSGRRSIIQYTLGANATATAGDQGTVHIDPAQFNYYPYDMAMDSSGNMYVNQYRSTAGQALAAKMWAPGTPPLTTPVWSIPADYTYADGITVNEARGWFVYGNYNTGYVWFWDKATGASLASLNFDCGSRARDVVFDAANNLYTVDNGAERLRVWSPGDGPNSKDFVTGQFTLNKTGSGGPTITDQPDDLTVGVGASASFTVVATGSNVTYQWLRNGAVMSGETSATLTFTAAAVDDGALYSCRVCDDNGVKLSEAAVLHVGISITQQPLSAAICANISYSLTVVAQGVGTLSYQWQKYNGTAEPPTWDNVVNGGNISGATTASLTFNPTATTNSGAYRVIITDSADPANPVTSSGATLTVTDGPAIQHVGYGATLAVGQTHPMSCYASGTGALSYQWKKDGIPIDGATNASYTITNANCVDHAGLYSCAVTDACGTKESSTSLGGGEARIIVGGVEICGNGRDDDCDNLTDCDDSDCDNDPNCVPPCPRPFADADGDSDVDHVDFAAFQLCVTGPDDIGGVFNADLCRCFDWDGDLDIDSDDHSKFELCASGPGVAADEGCAPYPTGNVVINEIVYDNYGVAPDDKEFVELYNADTVAVDIAGWLLRSTSGRNFILPAGPGGGPNLLAVGDFYVIGSGSILPPVDLSVSPSTDIWGNGETAIELVDRNQTVKDTVVYERFATGELTLTAPEGGVWGEFETSSALQSLSRYFDGRDTDVNGYDFGLRLQTPGASNESGSSVVTTFAVPDVDNATVGSDVAGLLGSFINGRVIDPTFVDANNLNAIAVSPQGGKAIIAWDPTGGGNSVHSTDLFDGAGGYDMWVYFDTTTVPDAAPGAETSIYGIMGTVGTFVYELNSFPDPEALLLGDVVTNNASTGVAWVYNRNHASQTRRLYLVNAKDGGNSRPGTAPRYWDVLATIDMSTVASGWYRLAISYSADGSVSGTFDTQTFAGTAQANLAGSFYIGYQESAGAVPTWLRPPTFDLRP